METPLQTPNPPVTMLGNHTSQEPTTFTVHCHDSSFKKVSVLDSAGKPLFRVEGATFGTSWSWRRKVWDSTSDQHIFDFRHKSLDAKNGWVVESPDGRLLCSLVHKSQLTSQHSTVDATVRTTAGEDVLVMMRHHDHGALTAYIKVGDTIVATIRKTGDNTTAPSRGDRDRSTWECQVAAGVDLSMVSIAYPRRHPLCLTGPVASNVRCRLWRWYCVVWKWDMSGISKDGSDGLRG